MKKNVSFAFVLMCLVTLLSLGEIISALSAIIALIKNFHIINALTQLCNIICLLAPPAFAFLLYRNRNKNQTSSIFVILMLCGIAELVGMLLKSSTLMNQIAMLTSPSWYLVILPFMAKLASIALGILLIVVASSIKIGKTSAAVKGLALVLIWLGIFNMIGSLIPDISALGSTGIWAAAKTIMYALALWCLPKTIYDYDNCFFFGSNALKLLVAIGIVVIFVIIVSNSIVNDSSPRGNCFNCGGDGWDSNNNCSCVWCGGDGYSSWNP